MEDAETLCDRIAILINGQMHCVGSVAELKQLNGGFNITILKKQVETAKELEKETANITEIFHTAFPECVGSDGKPIIIDDNIRKIVFDAHPKSSISQKMIDLENMRKSGAIKDYEISHKSLEDLFLELARRQISSDAVLDLQEASKQTKA